MGNNIQKTNSITSTKKNHIKNVLMKKRKIVFYKDKYLTLIIKIISLAIIMFVIMSFFYKIYVGQNKYSKIKNASNSRAKLHSFDKIYVDWLTFFKQ